MRPTIYCISRGELNEAVGQWLRKRLPARTTHVMRIQIGTPSNDLRNAIDIETNLTVHFDQEITWEK
jgi:hypothetical protein